MIDRAKYIPPSLASMRCEYAYACLTRLGGIYFALCVVCFVLYFMV